MSLEASIRHILLYDWDPHDVLKRIDVYGDSALSRYDTYIEPIEKLLSAGASEAELVNYLAEREAESLCFPSLGRERLHLVARRLKNAATPA